MAATFALELGVDLGPGLSADEARAIFAQGEEAVVFALLELANGWSGPKDSVPR
jgi:hypothetical protein